MLKPLAALAGVGAIGVGHALHEAARGFRLRRVQVPVLPPGSVALRVLHLSDLHLLPQQRFKQEWVSSLAALEPDLVVDTGDNLASAAAVPAVPTALGRLLDRPGVFVWGSNDYYSPVLKNPVNYLVKKRPAGGELPAERQLPWRDLRADFERAGWIDLTDRRTVLELRGLRIEVRGTDDAHLGRDDYATVAGPPAADTDLSVGVTHAPYLRLLDAMAADRLDLILAGHTHGGQLCIPGYGALVTNCDLDTRRVKGMSSHTVGDHTSALHVSAGLGCSPYAPLRFACPPEATLLTLTPRP